MYFSSNVKLLRSRRERTQNEVAFALKMKRSTLSGYENMVSQPTIKALTAFSEYYKVTIDTLIKIDLRTLSESQLSQLEHGFDVYIKGGKMRVLATTVDSSNNENIELVTEKAKAGYTNGFSDPEFMKELPVFQLPFLSKEKKYRTFQINGDSMLPIPDKSWVTGEFVQDWTKQKSGTFCILLTFNEGIVFKIIENYLKVNSTFRLISFNPLYEPYDIHISEVKEVWKFVHYIASEIPEPVSSEYKLAKTVAELQHDVNWLKDRVK